MRIKALPDLGSSNPPLGPYLGGQEAKRDRAAAAFADGVRVMGGGRRVVARVGLHGSEKFQIGSGNPSNVSKIYPDLLDVRYAARRKFRLTPGHFPYLSALVVPSGQTQQPGGIGYQANGAAGAVQLYVHYDNGVDTDDALFMAYLPVSGQQYAGEKTAAGAAWNELQRVEFGPCAPGDLDDSTNLRRWSEGVTVDLGAAYVAGVRCVDLCVQEMPLRYAREQLLDDPDWILPMLGAGSKPGDPDTMPEYPVDELAADEPSAGTILLAAAARRQQRELGPVVAEWSGWDESTQDVDDLEAAGVSTTSSSTFVDMLQTSVSAWSADNPGWSISSGGNAREHTTASNLLELRDLDACVPVRIRIYARRTVGGTSRVRFVSQGYSVAEIEVGSSTYAWYEATGYLRCGLGPEDASVMQMLGRTFSGGATLTVRHVAAEFYAA